MRDDAVLRRDVYFYVSDAVVLQDFADKGVHAFISVCVFVGDKRGFGCPEGTAFGFYAVGGDLIVERGCVAFCADGADICHFHTGDAGLCGDGFVGGDSGFGERVTSAVGCVRFFCEDDFAGDAEVLEVSGT